MISTRNLVESLEKKYSKDISKGPEKKLNESFIFTVNDDQLEPDLWGFDSEEEMDKYLVPLIGQRIVYMTEVTTGYYDIELENGEELNAVSEDHIVKSAYENLEEAQELNENPAVIAPIVAAAAPSIAKMGADVINHAVDKLTEEEPITEDYKDARGTDIYQEVLDWVQTKIDDFAGQIPVQDLSVEVEGYNPDWCVEDASEASVRALEKIQLEFAKALTDTYFEHYGE